MQHHRGDGTGGKLTMERYEKTVINSLRVHVILVACYFPFSPITALMLIRGLTLSIYQL